MRRLAAILLACGLTAGHARATDGDSATPDAAAAGPSARAPAGWRGDGSGCYRSAEPPVTWSAKKNVLWAAEVGPGQSSPVIVGGRVLVTAEPDTLICLDAATGKRLWRRAHKLSDMPAGLAAKAPRQSGQYGQASPTPVSDGKWVWVFFHTGIVACHDLAGNCRWVHWYKMRSTTSYGRTASPVLVGERLLVHFGPLACLDAATGKLLWASKDAKATYGTPARARIGAIDVVVTPAGDVVRVADGKVLASGLGQCTYTSPIVRGRIVYFVDRDMSAVRLPEAAGETAKCKELWYEELTGTFYASPVAHDGRLYTVDRSANYFVIDAATGKVVLSKALDLPPAGGQDSPNVYPSVCLAGRRLLVANDAGEAVFIEPGDKGGAVAAGSLPHGSGSTPTFRGKRMLMRGGKLLYCIGRSPARFSSPE